MSHQYIVFLFFIFLTFFSCKDEEIIPPIPELSEEGIFVLNEGNFTFGNGSLSYLDLNTEEIYNQIFFEVNGFPLGDVPQSILEIGDIMYIVVNNSGKIVAIDKNDFQHIGTISGMISPRYMVQISETEALVSDLYSKYVSIVDLETLQVSGSIFVGNSTEALLKVDNVVYATGWTYNDKLYKIDLDSRKVIDSLIIGPQPNSIVQDKDDKLWVLFDGSFQGSPYGHFFPGIAKVDPENFTVEEKLIFDSKDGSPKGLKRNIEGDTLYYINASYASSGGINKGVFRMSIYEGQIPVVPFIAEREGLFNGLAIAPVTKEIYISDARDYQRAGWLWRYSAGGELLDSFQVDLIPGEIVLKTK